MIGFSKTVLQAPWRKQSQVVGLVLAVVIFITLFAAVYLHLSARTAEIGRQIQVMQNDIERLDRENEDMKSQLAFIMSSSEMEKRAQTLGFKSLEADDILYLSVPGYAENPSITYQPYTAKKATTITVIPPEFTESLFDWLRRRISTSLSKR